MTDLQRKAREASAMSEAAIYSLNMQETINNEEPTRMQAFEVGISARSYFDGYIAAAAHREQEIERLRAELAKTKLPIWMLREEHEKEVAALRARVAELEGMVPKWTKASSDECRQLCIDGWVFMPGTMAMDGKCLMVPPIPLPETKT